MSSIAIWSTMATSVAIQQCRGVMLVNPIAWIEERANCRATVLFYLDVVSIDLHVVIAIIIILVIRDVLDIQII